MNEKRLSEFYKIRHLLSVEGLGNIKLLKLISALGSLDAIFNADFNTLKNIRMIDANLASRILDSLNTLHKTVETLKPEIDQLLRIKGNFLTYFDPEYPQALKQIYTPPLILYYLGTLNENDSRSVAIVGTRSPSQYGKLQAEKFAASLAQNGLTIVSGLARGIDSAAHKGALSVNGRTIAITGSGLDVIYPAENKKIYHEIAEKGLVFSEYKPGTKPDAQNFPKRNRIIAGLSLGTLVIETKLNGGAMQTAAHALEQNKEVFALPGNINSVTSEGTNRLIQNGEAKLVVKAEDVTEELGNIKFEKETKSTPPPELTMFENKIYEILDTAPKHIDSITLESGMNTSECLVNLLTMEFKGVCRQLPGKTFIKL